MSENDQQQTTEVQLAKKTQQRLTLEQRIKRAEQQLQKLKTQDRRTRNQRLILIGIAAESAAEKNANFRDVLAQHALKVLKPADFKKCEFKNRYGELIDIEPPAPEFQNSNEATARVGHPPQGIVFE